MRRMLLAGIVAIGGAATRAHAIAIAAGDGSGNTSEPTNINGTNIDGWNNVVEVNVVGTGLFASGIYLGGGWVLTAEHVGAGEVVVGGQPYQPSTTQYILNTPGFGSADMVLYKLQGDLSGLSSLSPISIPTNYTITTGTQFYAIGANGEDRGTTLSYFLNSNGTLTTTGASSSNFDYDGYFNNENATAKRWGTNFPVFLAPGTIVEPVNDNVGITQGFASEFENNPTFGEEVTPGDSGGGVFDTNDTLIGLNLGILFPNGVTSEPDASIFGNGSFYAYLPDYAAQIDQDMAAAPEPTAGALLGLGIATALLRRRRSAAISNAIREG